MVLSQNAEASCAQTRPAAPEEPLTLVGDDPKEIRRHIFGCNICRPQYFRPGVHEFAATTAIETISLASVRKQVEAKISDTHRQLEDVATALESSGDDLLRRFAGSSHRRAYELESMLRRVYPGMPSKKDFDARTLQVELCNTDLGTLKRRLLLPYVVLDEWAADPTHFIKVLHYRTAYPSHTWAAFDLMQLLDGFQSGELYGDWHSSCVSVSGDTYGTVVPFSAEAIHAGKYLGYPIAQHLFDAQHELAGLLSGICRHVDGNSGCQAWNATHLQVAELELGQAMSPVTVRVATLPPPMFDALITGKYVKTRLEHARHRVKSLQSSPQMLASLLEGTLNSPLQRLRMLACSRESPKLLAIEQICWLLRRPKLWQLVANMYNCLSESIRQDLHEDDDEGANDYSTSAVSVAGCFNRVAAAIDDLIVEQCRLLRILLPEPFDMKGHCTFAIGSSRGYLDLTQSATLHGEGLTESSSDSIRKAFITKAIQKDQTTTYFHRLSRDPRDSLCFESAFALDRFLVGVDEKESNALANVQSFLIDHVSDLRALKDLRCQLGLVTRQLDAKSTEGLGQSRIRKFVSDLHDPLMSLGPRNAKSLISFLANVERKPWPSAGTESKWDEKATASSIAACNFWDRLQASFTSSRESKEASDTKPTLLVSPLDPYLCFPAEADVSEDQLAPEPLITGASQASLIDECNDLQHYDLVKNVAQKSPTPANTETKKERLGAPLSFLPALCVSRSMRALWKYLPASFQAGARKRKPGRGVMCASNNY